MASSRGLAAGGSALSSGFVENHRTGCGDVEGADAASHGNAEQVVAGAANQIVKASAFAAQNENAVAAEVELVVVGRTALVEANHPDVLFFQFLQGSDKVDDAGDAQVLGGSGTGFHRNRAKRRGAAFGEDDSIDTCAIGNAEKRAEVLRIFHAIEGEEQARLRRVRRGEEIFNGQRFLGTDESNDALMGRISGQMREVFARFLAHTHSGLLAVGDETREAVVVSLGGNNHVIEAAPAGLERLSHRMYAVKNFHVSSVDGACYGCDLRRAKARQLSMALAARRSRPSTVCG